MPDRTEPEAIARALTSRDRRALARAITLVESTRDDHRELALDILQRVAPQTGDSIRIGVSGVPGVGKSTFIETFGNRVIEDGHRLAVLTVDPTSSRSGGSILGDKTRMPSLSQHPDAYIRPSPTGGALGGVGRHTRESILLCEAAGFDVVIVETVGVGQSEVSVAHMTDVFVLLMLPAGGDELQGIKRGIMELADVVLVNKSDGDLAETAMRTVSDYANAVRLLQPRTLQWTVPVEAVSALRNRGIDIAWAHVRRYVDALRESGELQSRRSSQSLEWMWEETHDHLRRTLESNHGLKPRIETLTRKVRDGEIPATVAAHELVLAFLGQQE